MYIGVKLMRWQKLIKLAVEVDVYRASGSGAVPRIEILSSLRRAGQDNWSEVKRANALSNEIRRTGRHGCQADGNVGSED